MKIKCKLCNDIIEGDKRGTYTACKCRAIAIDETPFYVRVIGDMKNIEDIEGKIKEGMERIIR